MLHPHPEIHRSHRATWLRAAVLGIDDGLVTVASLMLGLLASPHTGSVLFVGIAALVAGALSMAAGEYVSVSSQRDAELADMAIERKALIENPQGELQELALIYEERGLDPELALIVARKLHERDALTTHMRDELGIDSGNLTQPAKIAAVSAVAFSAGAVIPILAAAYAGNQVWWVAGVSLLALAVSGTVGAHIGGGHRIRAGLRVFLGGGLAMAITYLVGHLIGISV